MNTDQLQALIDQAKTAALAGGAEVMEVYAASEGIEIDRKADNSPLTEADRRAHAKIVETLGDSLPILSEEGASIPYAERKSWEYFWLVDPLDGTKEFIKRNGEFTVNIALIHQGQPIGGVVYVPEKKALYWALSGQGAFKQVEAGAAQALYTQPVPLEQAGIRVVASRSHLNDETQAFLDGLNEPQIVSMGSSLKFITLAEGGADVYPRYAPTMEWDTAAAHAVLQEAGGQVINRETDQPLAYNKENLLNPHFTAYA